MEDRRGEPFVGPAGNLLRRTLRHSGLDPDRGYYFNTVSCFPGGTPEKEAIVACRTNLKNQLDSVNASLILVCGATALSAVLPRSTLKACHGMVIHAHGKLLFPVYHPSFILRLRSGKTAADIETMWRKSIDRFAALVSGILTPTDIWNEYPHCWYADSSCTKRKARLEGEITCKKHRPTLVLDRQWKETPPAQQPLF